MRIFFKRLFFTAKRSLTAWLDTSTVHSTALDRDKNKVDWLQNFPYFVLHLSCLTVFWVGFSWAALVVAVALYAIRMFAITGFYHRYFSHRAFKTNRFWQFIFAILGNSAAQRGPLWWAAHHRLHHTYTDTVKDLHSPVQYGFWWSHFWWFTTREAFETPIKEIKDFAKYPELRWLDRFAAVVPLLLAVATYELGVILQFINPQFNTSGTQMLVWGFVISTACLHHATFSINSLAHLFGTKRYSTGDDSRNNFLLALITFGEGWHNNHHYFPSSASQGFFWWELDITYGILKLMSWMGIIWDLKKIPERLRGAVNLQEPVQEPVSVSKE